MSPPPSSRIAAARSPARYSRSLACHGTPSGPRNQRLRARGIAPPHRGAWARVVRIAGIAGIALSAVSALPAGAADGRLEATAWLQAYLRIDTSNPPGNEAQAVDFLHELLRAETPASALRTTRFTSPAGRMSLMAVLPATHPEPQPPLVLLHHIDVVPAPRAQSWTHPPFSGALADERIWGRGAVDSKGLGIAHLASLISAARRPDRARDLVFLAVADEEAGGAQGAAWLLQRFEQLVDPQSLVLAEGGVNRVQQGKVVWWGIEAAQKRPLWLRLSYSGAGGHGSTAGGNPVAKLLQGLGKLGQLRGPSRLTPPLWEHLRVAAPIASSPHGETFARDFASAEKVFRELTDAGQRHRWIPPGYRSVMTDTIQVNSIEAGSPAANMKPTEASAVLDVRLLPDTDPDAFVERIVALFEPGVTVETLLEANDSVLEVRRAHVDLALLVGALSPTAPVVPAMISGTTDSRLFRNRGIAAYGFSPFALGAADTQGIHAVDESIDLAVFERGVHTMVDVVLAFLDGQVGGVMSAGR